MGSRSVQQVQAILERVGIRPLSRPQPTALRSECSRLARLLRERTVHTVGLFPMGPGAAAMPAALELGLALAEQGAVVGVVDGSAGWPCARELDQGADEDRRAAATSWAQERVALLTPRPGARGAVDRLHEVLAQEGGGFTHLVLDLSGFAERGEHAAAAGLVNAWALVVRSGRVRGRDVRRRLADLPQATGLGVLLVGER